MLFYGANIQEVGKLHEILTTFERWTGKSINLSKSFLNYSWNMTPRDTTSISSLLRLHPFLDSGYYLGLLTCLPRSKTLVFQGIQEKVQRKVSRWKARALSQAMAAALPSYNMSVFLLPKAICHSINTILKNFWWDFNDDKQWHYHPKAWSYICSPKDSGGLGLRRMYDINWGMITKLGWQMLPDNSCLWVKVLKAKYLSHRKYMQVQPSSDSTWVWKGGSSNQET